jgi:putative ATP-dependent endonuclease of OLD family
VFLREIEIDHFRAIRRARLRFGASTTLTGENGCGTGSVVAALQLVLGGTGDALVSSTDAHRDGTTGVPSSDIGIRLVFEERAAGEWNRDWHAPLKGHVRPEIGRRRLILEAAAVAPRDGQRTELRLRVAGVDDEAINRSLVRHLRAMTPLLRIQGGTLTAHGGRFTDAVGAGARPPAEGQVPELVRRVLREADDLLSGTAVRPEQSIEAGAAAARDLLALSPRHFDPVGTGLANAVLEILGPDAGAKARWTRRPAGATIADRLGTLLLLAAILRQLPEGIGPGVEPLWIVEDPEAHLHPMTLVSTHRMLERIRWQKVVTTYSGDLLAAVPLAEVRRLIRHEGIVHVAGLAPRALSSEHLRRVGYHLRLHRGVAMFARVWLLVEGESEFWILPQVAQVLGYDLALEGICCVGFAQCGLEPLVRAAREFRIEWHLLADGDEAGQRYAEQARPFLRRHEVPERITRLDERDIEHCFWQHGHAGAIAEAAGLPPGAERRVGARQAIAKAVQRRSKPFLALKLVESVAARGPEGVPAPLARLVETCVALARDAPKRAVESGRALRTTENPEPRT